jgi:serine/threonine protein kinase
MPENDNKIQLDNKEETYIVSILNIPDKVDLTDIRDQKTGGLLNKDQALEIKNFFENKPPGRYSKKEIGKKLKNFPYGMIKQVGEDGKMHLYAIYKGKKHGLHLGEGGFGKTKLVQDIETGEWIVLKVTKSFQNIDKQIDEKTVRSMVSSEHKILSHFNRSKGNIISHLSKDKIQKYNITMKYVNGVELYQYLLNKPNLSMIEVLDIANGMVDSVREINRDHLHRDINPRNFMYNSLTREIVAIDLGFTVRKNEDGTFADTKIIETNEYLAPEIKSKKSLTYSEKTEVYALGVSLSKIFGITSTIDFKTKSPCSDDREIINLIKSMTNLDPDKRPSLEQAKKLLDEKRSQLVPLKLRTVGIVNIEDLISGKKKISYYQALQEVNEVVFISDKEVSPFVAMKIKRELEKKGIIVRHEIIVTHDVEKIPMIVEKLHEEQFKGMTVIPQFYFYHSSKDTKPEYKKIYPIKVVSDYKDYHPSIMKGLTVLETDLKKVINTIKSESVRLKAKYKLEEKSKKIFYNKDIAKNRVKLLDNFIHQLDSNNHITYDKLSKLLESLEKEMTNTIKIIPKFLLGETDGRKLIHKLKEEIEEDLSKKKKL